MPPFLRHCYFLRLKNESKQKTTNLCIYALAYTNASLDVSVLHCSLFVEDWRLICHKQASYFSILLNKVLLRLPCASNLLV